MTATSAPAYTVIDSDTHITEPPDTWTARVPARLRDRVPNMVRNADGKDVWMFEGAQISIVGATATAGWPDPFPNGPRTLDECHPAAYEPSARLRHMDEAGIWAQVVYPNVAGFGHQKFLGVADGELKLACVRAYNEFLRDWASVDPRRFVTIMAVPFWDVDAAAAEIERGAAAGHRGVLFTGKPHNLGLPFLGDRHWDPVWAAAADADMAVHFHIGSGDMATAFTPGRVAAHGSAAAYAFTSVELFMGNGIQVADLLLSGVLPRFPTLRFVSVESGIGWIPFVLEATDYSYLEGRPGRVGEWDLLPSEYFRRQVYTCFWFEQYAPQHMLDAIPVDRILFETDFPHPTCLYGNLAERIDAGLRDQPDDVRRKILWDNAAELYRIENP
jgi:predicted TIM-barrel fold metal-dependent hydrolase